MRCFVHAILVAALSATAHAQLQRKLATPKGITVDIPSPHPLSWWTSDPLRLDAGQNLMLGTRLTDGRVATNKDYRVKQSMTTIGTLAGHRILQLNTLVYAETRLISMNLATGEPQQWKSLLVEDGAEDRYLEIFSLRMWYGNSPKLTAAAVYGQGAESILGTFDSDGGNGGGCWDGYWWFDKDGAHIVDFSPLEAALKRVVPPHSRFTSNCWALHPEQSELKSWVQRDDAECHACGGMGQVLAKYRIKHGVAIPISVRFEPESSPGQATAVP